MQIWIFRMRTATKIIFALLGLTLSGCTLFSSGQGQVIYHWQRPRTGVEKFSRDHSECLRLAEDFRLLPDFRSWFYSEEAKLDVRADWHSDKGIWASYVPHEGAQPLMVNSLRDDRDISPRKYRQCMEARGYTHRTGNIPDSTNLYIYSPQRVLQNKPFNQGDF